MRSCIYCGRELEKGEVCDCPQSVAHRAGKQQSSAERKNETKTEDKKSDKKQEKTQEAQNTVLKWNPQFLLIEIHT